MRIGAILYGFETDVAFVGFSHEDKTVEAMGIDWVILRGNESGQAYFHDGQPEDLEAYLVPEDGDADVSLSR